MIEAVAMIPGKEWAVWIPVGSLALIGLLGLGAYFLFYRQAPKGKAMVRMGLWSAKVNISGMVVLPFVHQVQLVNLGEKVIKAGRHTIALCPKDNDLACLAIGKMQKRLGGESQLLDEIRRKAESQDQPDGDAHHILAYLREAYPPYRFSFCPKEGNPQALN